MSDIQRFDPVIIPETEYSAPYVAYEYHDGGDCVLASDHDATITTLRQQLAAAARECEAWRTASRTGYLDWSLGEGSHGEMMECKADVAGCIKITDALIPDLAAAGKGAQ